MSLRGGRIPGLGTFGVLKQVAKWGLQKGAKKIKKKNETDVEPSIYDFLGEIVKSQEKNQTPKPRFTLPPGVPLPPFPLIIMIVAALSVRYYRDSDGQFKIPCLDTIENTILRKKNCLSTI